MEANLKRREEFLATVVAIQPERLILLDKSGVTISMTRQGGGRRRASASTKLRP
jgi:hypothetical protein